MSCVPTPIAQEQDSATIIDSLPISSGDAGASNISWSPHNILTIVGESRIHLMVRSPFDVSNKIRPELDSHPDSKKAISLLSVTKTANNALSRIAATAVETLIRIRFARWAPSILEDEYPATALLAVAINSCVVIYRVKSFGGEHIEVDKNESRIIEFPRLSKVGESSSNSGGKRRKKAAKNDEGNAKSGGVALWEVEENPASGFNGDGDVNILADTTRQNLVSFSWLTPTHLAVVTQQGVFVVNAAEAIPVVSGVSQTTAPMTSFPGVVSPLSCHAVQLPTATNMQNTAARVRNELSSELVTKPEDLTSVMVQFNETEFSATHVFFLSFSDGAVVGYSIDLPRIAQVERQMTEAATSNVNVSCQDIATEIVESLGIAALMQSERPATNLTVSPCRLSNGSNAWESVAMQFHVALTAPGWCSMIAVNLEEVADLGERDSLAFRLLPIVDEATGMCTATVSGFQHVSPQGHSVVFTERLNWVGEDDTQRSAPPSFLIVGRTTVTGVHGRRATNLLKTQEVLPRVTPTAQQASTAHRQATDIGGVAIHPSGLLVAVAYTTASARVTKTVPRSIFPVVFSLVTDEAQSESRSLLEHFLSDANGLTDWMNKKKQINSSSVASPPSKKKNDAKRKKHEESVLVDLVQAQILSGRPARGEWCRFYSSFLSPDECAGLKLFQKGSDRSSMLRGAIHLVGGAACVHNGQVMMEDMIDATLVALASEYVKAKMNQLSPTEAVSAITGGSSSHKWWSLCEPLRKMLLIGGNVSLFQDTTSKDNEVSTRSVRTSLMDAVVGELVMMRALRLLLTRKGNTNIEGSDASEKKTVAGACLVMKDYLERSTIAAGATTAKDATAPSGVEDVPALLLVAPEFLAQVEKILAPVFKRHPEITLDSQTFPCSVCETGKSRMSYTLRSLCDNGGDRHETVFSPRSFTSKQLLCEDEILTQCLTCGCYDGVTGDDRVPRCVLCGGLLA